MMRVEIVRGTVVESVHRVHAAVVGGDGQLRAWSGNPDLFTFSRSTAKPFQTLAIVADGVPRRFGYTPREIAVCAGSHSGEDRHVRTVQSMLNRVGARAEMLACGPHDPMHAPSREALRERGLEPGRLHNNCSGKHAGMLALARIHGWDADGYQCASHPVQARMLKEVAYWTRRPEEGIALANDGCGVICFGLPLKDLAGAYARLAAAFRAGKPKVREVIGAMMEHPDMVAGAGRLCTDLMHQVRGRLFAKLGAEGLYCVGVPGAELGIALKVEDGASRAVAPAVLGMLHHLKLISDDDLGGLEGHAFPELFNTRGELVGQIRPSGRLNTPEV